MTRLPSALDRSSAAILSALAFLITPGLVGQESASPFNAAQIVNDRYDRFDATVDLDLDGDPDYLGSWQYNGKVYAMYYINRGDGLPASPVSLGSWSSTARDAIQFVVADFDGDNHDDVVMVGLDQIRMIYSRKTGPAVQTATTAAFGSAGAARVGDVTGDGRPDIVMRDSNRIRVYDFWQGTFHEIASYYTLYSGLELANVDQDPALEVCVYYGSFVAAFTPNASGGFSSDGFFTHKVRGKILMVAGDVDGDKDLDLVVFAEDSVYGDYSVLRHNGTTLVAEANVKGGPATHFADFDGDGDLDGLCCGGGTGGYSWQNDASATFMVCLNDGKGLFTRSFPIAGMGARYLAGCVDVDGDGDKDLVAGRCIVFNRGDIDGLRQTTGAFGKRDDRLIDVDGDGDLDHSLVATPIWVQYMGNRGRGTFQRDLVGIGSGGPARTTIATADFDGDGDPDILVEDEVSSAYQMRLMTNHAGFFQSAKVAAAAGLRFSQTSKKTGSTGRPSHWQLTGDWDNDGFADLVMVDEGNQVSKLWRNNGAGFFLAGPRLPVGVVVLRIADFNGDKKSDLIVGTAGDYTTMGLMLGTGTSFGAVAAIATSRAERPGVVDIDGDGDLDIIASSILGGDLLLNDGTARFTSLAVNFGALPHVRIWCDDLNSDGRQDVACYMGGYGGGITTAISLQKKDGSFATTFLIARPRGLADIDWDGDIDIVGDPLILNRTTPARSAGVTVQYGHSSRGFGGIAPVMGNVGVLAVNARIEKRIVGARGGAPGFFFLGLKPLEYTNPTFPGLTLFVDPVATPMSIVASGTSTQAGVGKVSIPWSIAPGMGGLAVYSQAFFVDAAAPAGLSQTNAVATVLPH